MAKNYYNKLEEGIDELIANLQSKTNWPHDSEKEIQKIINDLMNNRVGEPGEIPAEISRPEPTHWPRPRPADRDREPSTRSTGRTGPLEEPETETKEIPEEEKKKAKLEAKIIIKHLRKIFKIFNSNKFIQGETIEFDALVAQGEKTIKDFKINWKIIDKKTKREYPANNPGTGYNAGDPSSQKIDTSSMEFPEKGDKYLDIILHVVNPETDEIIIKVTETCIISPKPGLEEGPKEKIKPETKEKPEEEKKKTAKEEKPETAENLSLNLFNEEGVLISDGSHIQTVVPKSDANFIAITTPADLAQRRKLNYKWTLIKSISPDKNKVIKLNVSTETINYAFVYNGIQDEEMGWALVCELVEPLWMGFREKVILSAKGFITKPKEKIKPETIEGEENPPKPAEGKRLDPKIIRIHHAKELPKRKAKPAKRSKINYEQIMRGRHDRF